MLCGSPAFLKDVAALLDQHGLVESPRMGEMGDYVIERAFVENKIFLIKTEAKSSVFISVLQLNRTVDTSNSSSTH